MTTLNTGDITFNDITYNINNCNITYMFYQLLYVNSFKSKISYN